jgi:hypothetical protein
VRWTEADLARFQQRAPLSAAQVRKYRNKPVVENGVRYDSKLELRCGHWLDLRKGVGEVLWYTRQVPFRLEGGVIYRADYLAVLVRGGVEVIDSTGRMTLSKANKLKQVKARYGVVVIVWTDKR